MLEIMKELLNIDVADTTKDNVLNHYIYKANSVIRGYCCIVEIPESYESIIVDFAIYLYKNRNAEGVQSQSQGSRSVTYTDVIPETIRLALPKPKIKVGC